MENTKPISLDDAQASTSPQISLDASDQSTALPSDVAQSRARKIEFGAGASTGVTKDQAYQAISMGQEAQLRRGAAAFRDQQKSDQQRKLITDAVSERGFISPEETQFIADKFSMSKLTGQSAPTDPSSVLEEMYAGQYLKPMYNVSDAFHNGSFMPEAMEKIPEHVDRTRQVGESILATNEIIRTRLENARAKLKNESFVGSAVDFGKELIPGYIESTLKGGWSNVLSGGLRGTAMLEKAQEYWSLPPDQLRTKFNADMDAMEAKDPALAVDYAEHMLGFSTSEKNLQNAFSTLDIGTLPVAGAAKVATRLIRGAAAVTGVTGALEAKVTNAAIQAVKSSEGTGTELTNIINEQFSKHYGILDSRVRNLQEQLKEEPTMEGGLAEHEGIQSQIDDLKQQKIDLKNWHDKMLTNLGTSVVEQLENLGKIKGTEAPVQRTGIWANKDTDLKVNIVDEPPSKGPDGRLYQKVNYEGKDSYVPVDELKETTKDTSLSGLGKVKVSQVADKDPAVSSAVGRGDMATAGLEKAANEAFDTIKGTADPVKSSVEALPDSLNQIQKDFASNPGRDGQEIVNRMGEQTKWFTDKLQEALTKIVRPQRIPPGVLQIKSVLQAISDYTKDLYPGIRNSILNVTDPYLNDIKTNYFQKVIFGRSTGEMFGSEQEAKNFAWLNGLTGETTEQSGLGWYLSVERPLDETSHPIRDGLLKLKETETPGGWLNATLGWLRTPEDTLSLEQNLQRKLAVYNASPFMSFAKASIQDIQKLGGIKNARNWYRQWKDWERAVSYARDAMDPDEIDPAKAKGYFFKTGGELDDWYQTNMARFPSAAEKTAYFSFKRLNEYDRILRSMAIYRNKVRIGTESHTISVLDTDGKTILKSPAVDGIRMAHKPGGQSNVLVMGDKIGDEKVIPANDPRLKKYEDAIQNGETTVIRLFDPAARPLKGFGTVQDQRIRYVFTNMSESKPLSISDQLPKRGGGHFEYDYQHYLKQADVQFDKDSNTYWYEGDRTVMPIGVRAMGETVVKHLNAVRELIKDDKIAEAEAYAKQNVAAIPWTEHLSWYKGAKDASGKYVAPRLNMNEDIKVVSTGKTISDLDNSLRARYEKLGNFRDGTVEGSDAKVNQVQYTGQRDAYDVYTLNDKGTRNNPLYSYEPAKMVDPVTTMNRALSRIVNSTLMDDYKIFSVEQWIQQAKNFLDLKGRDLSDVDRSPFHFFNNPTWKKDMPEEIKKSLELTKLKVNQLVGLPSSTDNFLHRAQQALADSIYKGLGPKAVDITPSWLLPSLRDPFRFLRSVVFNEKMGLFSIPQYLVHAMTIANAIGIAGPEMGMKGMVGALFHGWHAINPSALEHMDALASKMGWLPGEFKESIETVGKTGFMNVAGEHVFLDAPLANRVIQSSFGKFLDAGQMFFRGGVTTLRSASWHMAFKEFRAANPVGRIAEDDIKRILYRADTLSHNMSRASTSTLTTGVMSIPAQFYTYQLRLFELMAPFIGGRLTWQEKARLLGTNAVLFGAPVSLGLYLYPWGDHLRSYAQQNGYVVGDKFLNSLAMEGGIATMIATLTGGGDIHKGNWYNAGERWGAKGLDVGKDLLEGDKTFMQIFGGAAVQSLSNTVTQSNGLMTMVMSGIRGDGDALGKSTPDDWIGPFKEISSVNAVWRTFLAMRFNNWMSKNNASLHPTSVWNALQANITGLSEQRDTDIFTMSQDIKAEKALDNHLFSMFQKKFALGVQNQNNNDPEQAKAYFKQAFEVLHMGGYPEEKIPEAVSAAVRANSDSLQNRTNFNYYIRDMHNKQPEAFGTADRINQERGEP